MLNKAPIFINGFQRGGTNILVNLLASHPDVGKMRVETHEVFYGRETESFRKWVNRFFYIPIFATARKHILWPYRLFDRPVLPKIILRYIDLCFFVSKLSSNENRQLSYKVDSSYLDIAKARLLAKNVNGVVLASNIFADMYPDAHFVALVRNGFALCEGFMRRGWSADRIGELYDRVIQQMILDSENLENYHIVRFEHMISAPNQFLEMICKQVSLEFDRITHVRLQAKSSMNNQGVRHLTFGSFPSEISWFPIDEVGLQFRTDVDENQLSRLSYEDKKQFLNVAHKSMERLGYI